MRTYYYIDDGLIQLLNLVKVEDKFYLDEDKEIEVILDKDDHSLYASWWYSCDDYTSFELFNTREAAVDSLKESLKKRIEFLQQKLAALE